MADPNPGESGNSVSMTAGREFEIPPLLKTEPIYIEDDIKPTIYSPCPIPKFLTISVVEGRNNILFNCDGCGKSGSGLLDSGYRIIKTAMLVEVGIQTGSRDTEIEVETPKIIELENRCLDHEMEMDPVKMESVDPFYYDSVPDIVPPADTDSFDNGKFMCAISRSSYGFPTLFAAEG
eukprot:sb/3471831/